jgi:hypothetical protein
MSAENRLWLHCQAIGTSIIGGILWRVGRAINDFSVVKNSLEAIKRMGTFSKVYKKDLNS